MRLDEYYGWLDELTGRGGMVYRKVRPLNIQAF